MSFHNTDDNEAVSRAAALFRATFHDAPTVAAAAPGRVNLIGEHVDYNDGFVFPLALQKNTYIVAAPAVSPSDPCRVISDAYPGHVAAFVPGDTPADPAAPKWTAYMKGMTAIYARHGHSVAPFRAAIVSDVPRGGGLSSSAALEMATAMTLEAMAGIEVEPAARAKMGQACEHEFAGVPCGIMDQLISSLGEDGRALLIDCRSLQATPVSLDHPDAVVVVANSRVAHELSGSEYPSRRRQCHEAARAIAQRFPQRDVTHLRDCSEDMLSAVESALDGDTVKRARHVILEDVRTLRAKEALEVGDLQTVGKLMHESHKSLRDLFEVSTKEIDALVDIAMSVDGVYGSRITGGGFGGCTVTLVHRDSVSALEAAFRRRYPDVSGGLEADVFSTKPGVGSRVLTSVLRDAR